MAKAGAGNHLKDKMNQATPGLADAQLGDRIDQLITAYNDLANAYNGLLAQLDTDAVGSATYASNFGVSDTVTTLDQQI